MRNNPVFQVLATSGNQAVAPKGTTLDGLAVGQIGLFDRDTNLAINSTDVAPEVYLAMAVQNGGQKTIVKSAGQFIQAANVRDILLQCYEEGLPKQIEVHNMTSIPNEDYTMKFQFMNGDLLGIDGFQLPTKSYSVFTKKCDKCNPCPQDEDCRTLPVLFYDEIAQDSDNLLTVQLIEPDGTVIERANFDTWAANAANDDKCPGLRITAVKESVYSFCCINTDYNYLRETDINLSLVDGFSCSKATVNVTQAVQYEQGAGYDLAQKEYFAGGWNGNPGVYRVSSVFGLPLGDFNFQAKAGTNYSVISFLYDLDSISGWRHYENNLETLIGVPCTDTTTLTGLAALLDGWIETNVRKTIKPIAAVASSCDC